MPTALPVIRGTSAALYPFTQTISFDTAVMPFQNGAQQRWARRTGLMKFEIPYAHLTQANKNTVKAAVTSAKGQFDTTLTLALGATTYTNLSLDSDDFSATEAKTTQYAAPVKLSQSIAQSLSPGTAGTTFPTLANGTMGILPYTQTKRFQTIVSKMQAGPKWTYAEFAGGLTGFPTDGQFSWTLDEKMLTDADLATRVAHFIANYGRLRQFSFVDEDAVTYTKVHYAMDEMVITYSGVNDSAVKISLEESY